MAYTTASLIEAELRATSVFDTTTNPTLASVTEWIAETDSYIDGVASRVYDVATYTDIFHYNGEYYLFLKNTPLSSVTTVEYNSAARGEAPSWATLTLNTHYLVDDSKAVIMLVFGTGTTFAPRAGFNRFRVTYDSGYSTIPKNIQMLATKLVAERVLSSLITKNVNERNDGGSISVGDISIVEPASYGVNSYKQLKTDIKELERKVQGGFKVYRYG